MSWSATSDPCRAPNLVGTTENDPLRRSGLVPDVLLQRSAPRRAMSGEQALGVGQRGSPSTTAPGSGRQRPPRSTCNGGCDRRRDAAARSATPATIAIAGRATGTADLDAQGAELPSRCGGDSMGSRAVRRSRRVAPTCAPTSDGCRGGPGGAAAGRPSPPGSSHGRRWARGTSTARGPMPAGPSDPHTVVPPIGEAGEGTVMLAGAVRPTGAVGGDVDLVDLVAAHGEARLSNPERPVPSLLRRRGWPGGVWARGAEAEQGGAIVRVVGRRHHGDAGGEQQPGELVLGRGGGQDHDERARAAIAAGLIVRHRCGRRGPPTGPRGRRSGAGRGPDGGRCGRPPRRGRRSRSSGQPSVGNSRQPPRCGGTPPRPRTRMTRRDVPVADSATERSAEQPHGRPTENRARDRILIGASRCPLRVTVSTRRGYHLGLSRAFVQGGVASGLWLTSARTPIKRGINVTYCMALRLDEGLIFLSDTRTNAGVDNVGNYRKLHVLRPAEDRVFVLQSAGSLATTHEVLDRITPTSTCQATTRACEPWHRSTKRRSTSDGSIVRSPSATGRRSARRQRPRSSSAARSPASGPTSCWSIPRATTSMSPMSGRSCRSVRASTASSCSSSLCTPRSTWNGDKIALSSMISTAHANLSVGPPYDLGLYRNGSLEVEEIRLEADSPYLASLRDVWMDHFLDAIHQLPALPD